MGVGGRGVENDFKMIQAHYIYCANDNLYLQQVPSIGITASVPPQIIRH